MAIDRMLSILTTAQAIHAACSGSGDPMSDALLTEAVDWLTDRITSGWAEPTSLYDATVRALAFAAVSEGEARLVGAR